MKKSLNKCSYPLSKENVGSFINSLVIKLQYRNFRVLKTCLFGTIL